MLETLRIKNLALVEDLSWELGTGLNIITGETGAGKSIITGALNLLLGERADKGLIRAGAEVCTVEACLHIPPSQIRALNLLLTETSAEPCDGGTLLIKRTFSAAGANKQFVNGSAVPLGALKKLGDSLIDMHGPHDHQSLFDRDKQLRILDAFAGCEADREQFAEGYARLRELMDRKAALALDEKSLRQQIDLITHQVAEIKSAQLKPGDGENIETEYRRASNAQRLLETAQNAANLFHETDPSILGLLSQVGRNLRDLAQIDPAAAELEQTNARLFAEVQGLHGEIGNYIERVEANPAALQELSEKISILQTLKRKYGSTVEEILAAGAEAETRLNTLLSRDVELEKLEAETEKLRGQLTLEATALSQKRLKAGPKLAKQVTQELRALGFKQAHFEVKITMDSDALTSTGGDDLEFLFAPNPGEPVSPLRMIASSGEISRVMLAIKTVLADVDDIPILVFDEIDANVGGETAMAVGRKMREIASKHQVLCITHLPQMAAHAHAHFRVEKNVRDGRTFTDLTPLAEKDRIGEIARMLGESSSRSALEHARELIRKSKA
ncbi:MAG: DNA repair protein RecN [Verrucomicrobiae bacterium]|nr:DNA repair protein RecN [Verrucomicrobiae bacterium]